MAETLPYIFVVCIFVSLYDLEVECSRRKTGEIITYKGSGPPTPRTLYRLIFAKKPIQYFLRKFISPNTLSHFIKFKELKSQLDHAEPKPTSTTESVLSTSAINYSSTTETKKMSGMRMYGVMSLSRTYTRQRDRRLII